MRRPCQLECCLDGCRPSRFGQISNIFTDLPRRNGLRQASQWQDFNLMGIRPFHQHLVRVIILAPAMLAVDLAPTCQQTPQRFLTKLWGRITATESTKRGERRSCCLNATRESKDWLENAINGSSDSTRYLGDWTESMEIQSNLDITM